MQQILILLLTLLCRHKNFQYEIYESAKPWLRGLSHHPDMKPIQHIPHSTPLRPAWCI